MTFPHYFEVLGLRLHPHPVLEVLAYGTGARLYFAARRRQPVALPLDRNLWLLVGCIFGALAGSRLLAWAESPDLYLAALRTNPLALAAGKTIAGGLLGGWAGIELAKRRLGISQSTGDLFVWPLAVGTAIGRVGCFLTGLDDHTFGLPTRLPWGVDFGDGVARHPTQLYESLAVLLVAMLARRGAPSGARFRLYFAGYFIFRFGVEFLKPRETPLAGLSAIQLASLAGIFLSLASLRRLSRPPAPTPIPAT